MSIEAEPSETLFRSPWEDHELFTVAGQNGRMVMFPGGTRHATGPWNETEPRISIAFNVGALVNLLSP